MKLRKYKCGRCENSYKSPGVLRIHIDSFHEGLRRYECNFCEKRFTQSSHRNTHIKLKHSESSLTKCEICEKLLDTKYIEQHNKCHMTEKIYECEICNMGFSTTQTLHIHRNLAHNDIHINCNLCDKVFKTLQALKYHKQTTHAKTDEKYQCDICEKTFQVLRQCKDHYKRMHSSFEIKSCKVCNKSFKSGKNLEKHMAKVHDNGNRYELCNICEIMVVNLPNHIKNVHFSQKENCLLCGKDVSHLKSHLERIHGEINKLYQCEICGYRSLTKPELKKHSDAKHSTVQNLEFLTCFYCEKTYRTKKRLGDHIQKYHE